MSAPQELQPVFFYDLADPWCYLAAERIMSTLPVVPEWEPVLARDLDGLLTDPEPDPKAVARRARELGLLSLRWPTPWPPDARQAALAATYAKRGGRVVTFSLAAFRQAFAGGRDLGEPATVLISAAACEMHPTAVLKGIELRSTAEALRRAGERARASALAQLPAITVGECVFEGDGAVEEAAAELGSLRR